MSDKVELLFFSSQQKLLNAMSPLYSRLTEEELNRNKHGPCLLYTYDSTLNFPVSSSMPGKFPDLSCCHARYEFSWHEHSDTLRFWVLLITLKGTDGKLLWLEISTCNICLSVGCLNCNSQLVWDLLNSIPIIVEHFRRRQPQCEQSYCKAYELWKKAK